MKSIRDVAKRAHVSVSTVSKSFGNATDISEETKMHVLKCAAELGYIGRNQKNKTKSKLCILTGVSYENAGHFGYEVIVGFKTAALMAGYESDVFPIRPGDLSYNDIVASQNYAGGFLLGLKLKDDYTKELTDTVTPSVLLDNYIENENVAYVGTDDNIGLNLAVGHLAKLGHVNIAFLNGSGDSRVSIQRDAAFRQACKSFKLEIIESNIVFGDFYNDVAPKYVPQFLKNGVTAIICASDIIAADVKNMLLRLRKKVPEDVSIIGYDDILPAQYGGLTTVAQSRLDLGKMAFFALSGLISGVKINKIFLRPHLTVRGSTAAVNGQTDKI